ncbi:capsular polysaccharide synthesis enzyme [Listeria grandensis FSL F6-0971]|uniref:Capsular polysaccharide synthesis enzyme n=2 Tax=Listeria grandensis TaxID=1494963 RepID=W7BJG1_9LIST|nr:nucleotide sugar dehydrogenase [Listeria grandensis]EUJ19913.1 capsular polysaccharide synthesis enzyme [Listeria grandensis FSL F6-0971]MBC1937854.1 nucleotide sugar dehydrogenase [Listeria grandensis]
MKINVMGLGYIGLPTALIFAKYGANVVGVDISKEIVEKLNAGEVHIEEPGISAMLQRVVDAGNFKASMTPEKADVFIIAVPTPNRQDVFKSCDLTYVKQAMLSILPYLKAGNTVIIESTVSPRTTEGVVKVMIEQAGFTVGQDIYLVHCPERVLPGKILEELIFNNRIIGGVTEACTKRGKEIYELFVRGELIGSTASAAELSKLMENTYRDVNIALANELVKVGDALNIDALQVIEMANRHPRVNIHQPGPGVGGHCLAVDPYFIISEAPEQTTLIQAARQVNNAMPQFVIDKVQDLMRHYQSKTLTILGVSYKGNTDDIRESPAMTIYKGLQALDEFDIRVYDPHVTQSFITPDLKTALKESELALILCDHDVFRSLVPEAFSSMKKKIIFDTKNCIELTEVSIDKYNMGNFNWGEKSYEGKYAF